MLRANKNKFSLNAGQWKVTSNIQKYKASGYSVKMYAWKMTTLIRIKKVMDSLTTSKCPNAQMKRDMSEKAFFEEAINSPNNGKTAGLDGFPINSIKLLKEVGVHFV